VQGFIGLLKKHIVNKDRYLGLCGCICQDQKTIDHLVKTFPFISFIIGTNNLSQLPNAIADAISNQKIVCHTNLVNSDLVEDLPNDRTNDRYKAFVNIMQGCDKFCTYCIIPYTRGRIRCRSAIAILNEIKELYHNGYKEVTLVGTNVNSYRDKKIGFIELLEKVCKTKIARVRFVTSNP
jgi:tRNA-2-methylthio-N6-dimethylallyladenosine synthase